MDAIGGVRLCLKAPLVDPAAGLHLHKGCQVLNGGEALGFVRSAAQFRDPGPAAGPESAGLRSRPAAQADQHRGDRQPVLGLPAASGIAGTLTVDRGTHLFQLLKVAFALRSPITTTVPIAGNIVTPSNESALQWNRTLAFKLFHEIRNDERISKSLITGSKQAG